MKTTRRGILHTLVLSLAVALASTACGDFKDYDDRVFDFPEKAAPPVPNPIPYEPPPEEPMPEPAAEEKKAEGPAAAAPESEKKAVKAEKAEKAASGVKSIKVKGKGDAGASSAEPALPPDSPHPVASEELNSDSEGPGRVEPENEPPRKNVGHRLGREMSKRQKMLDRFERQLQEGDDPGILRGGGRRRAPALGGGRDGKMHHGGHGLGRAKNGD